MKSTPVVLLLLCSLVLIIPDVCVANDDDDAIFNKFIAYIGEVYLSDPQAILEDGDHVLIFGEAQMSARVIGYALGNLRRYARRGTDNHAVLLMLERKSNQVIMEKIENEGRIRRWDIVYHEKFTEQMKERVWRQMMAAQQGWLNPHMEKITHVLSNEAPDFFDRLATREVVTATETQTRTEDAAPVRDPDPLPIPAGQLVDAVSGSYQVTGRYTDNDPRCGSSVLIKGSMLRTEAEFKLWDWTGVTWHYKGRAQWDGSGEDGRIRDLVGTVQGLLPGHEHVTFGLSIRIERDDGGVWRAKSIIIGGNLFNLRQIQSDPPQKVIKALAVRNNSSFRIYVYLERDRESRSNLIGTIDSLSSEIFDNLPGIGRYYIAIAHDEPGTRIKSFSRLLYVKDEQYGYAIRVEDQNFR